MLLNLINPDIKLTGHMIERVNNIDRLVNEAAGKIKYKVAEEYRAQGVSYDQDTLNAGIHNLKIYYLVALLDPKNEHAVSEFVDPYWHFHVLFTQDYHEFCNVVFNQYIHHSPLIPTDTAAVAKVEELYEYTLNLYGHMFVPGTIDERVWPKGCKVCLHVGVHDDQIVEDSYYNERDAVNVSFAA